MKKGNNKKSKTSKRIFNCTLFFLLMLVIGALFIVIGTGILMKAANFAAMPVAFISVLALVLLIALFLFSFAKIKKSTQKALETYRDKNVWYESILDTVPFPIQVIDNTDKWTYMNRACEEILVKNGVIQGRTSAYGTSCTVAEAEGSGNWQLKENNNPEMFLDWYGTRCKQLTAVLKDQSGNDCGFVEVITDLTSIMRVNDYASYEIIRLSDNIDSIAGGNLDINLEVTPADEYTEEISSLFVIINESMGRLRNSINTLDQESQKLSKAGLDGNLDIRGDESCLDGIFQHIIHGMNETFDSIKIPMDAASDFIISLAEGTAAFPAPETFKGYYGKLICNLNTVYASFQTLLSESGKLIEAGQNGELSVRGDTRLLKGGYAEIIDGFNKTLDAVVKPLQAGAEVLGKFAYNDFSSEVPDVYQGEFKQLTESINLVRTRFLNIQDVLVRLGSGDMSLLETVNQTGKRSENDQIVPAIICTYRTISNLISETERLAAAASEGRLEERGNPEQFEGGYRQIIEALNQTLEAVNAPVVESSLTLQKLAQGDSTASMTGEYQGEYDKIKTSMNHAIEQFDSLLGEIRKVTNQVAGGSKQVSQGSQLLSQGATEQASSLEELTASISEVSSQTNKNAEAASNASSLAFLANNEVSITTEKMGQMLDSMHEISESSANISKVIKAIDDIAFQTNILALNAAVEAARAGQYGKGFAVVADEVRNLAAKSAQAAKETTLLIESSINRVEAGSKTAGETADLLAKISQSIQKVAGLVGIIAMSSNDQATAITQINQGLNQISRVVQTNSATAEESAASSEELSSQADILEGLVGQFKVNNHSESSF